MRNSPPKSNRRILVIDDHLEIHDDFRKILRQDQEEADPFEVQAFGAANRSIQPTDFQVEFASQGQEGLEMVERNAAAEQPYALAFIDMRMPPGWDGVETTSRIWQVDPNLQVVICTAYSDYSWQEMTARLGRSDRMVILKKPFDQIEVLQLASAMAEKWQLIRHTERMVRDLEQTVATLRWRTAFFEAMVHSSPDGILVVNEYGHKVLQNEQLNRLLKLPPEIAAKSDGSERIRYLSESVKNSEPFLKKVGYLNTHRDETSTDEIEFKDGTVLDRYTSPVLDQDGTHYGRIWAFRDITEQKRMQSEVAKAQEQLLLASRRAGMAEVATGVLHNVGNVLNSISVAATCVAESIRAADPVSLTKVVNLLREHENDLGNFITADPQGKQVVGFLAQLGEFLTAGQAHTLREIEELQRNVAHVKSVVLLQQGYAKVSGMPETLAVADLVDGALRMNGMVMPESEIQVTRELGLELTLSVEKHKALQILVNLLRNAKEACRISKQVVKQLSVGASLRQDRVFISVSDNGVGIPSHHLNRIFAHGFTTKPDGHGFGLHSAALTATEMGGRLSVQSPGAEQGATFTLELPLSPPKTPK
jgi:signal transduction histidine kinase